MTENYDLDWSRASGNSKNYFEQPSSSVLGPYICWGCTTVTIMPKGDYITFNSLLKRLSFIQVTMILAFTEVTVVGR